MRIDLTTGKPHPIDSEPQGEVTALAPSSQGIWAAYRGRVGFATGNDWKSLSEKRPNTPITSLAAASASDYEVWIGTHDGLWRGDVIEKMRLHLTDTPPDEIGLSSGDALPPRSAI